MSEQTAGARPRVWRGSPLIVLALLFCVNLSNNLDRSIMQIMAQPIKEEFGLADWQLGLMTGFSFSMLYLLFGFPMARLADRGNRSIILSLCTAAWSAMTALCGATTTFLQLCLCRAGVGIGEAGCLPASHSLISDTFPSEARTRALAVYGLGLPLGGLAGAAIGGLAMDRWGWRSAFIVIGLPGVLLALVVYLLVREPARGRFDRSAQADEAQSFCRVLGILWRSPVGRNIILAIIGAGLAQAPNAAFLGPFLIRKFHVGYTELGFTLALTFMLGSALSTIGGGLLIHGASRADPRWSMWIPAIGAILSIFLFIGAYAQESWHGMVVLLFLGSVAGATYLAPCFAALHGVVAPSGRAKASVIAQFALSLTGGTIGPFLGGLAIDLVAKARFAKNAIGSFATACPGGHASPGASVALGQACSATLAEATQIVLIGAITLLLWPALHFLLAARAIGAGEKS